VLTIVKQSLALSKRLNFFMFMLDFNLQYMNSGIWFHEEMF